MTDSLLHDLGTAVRALRRDKGYSQGRLAEASGLSRRYLAQLESGSANVSVKRLAQVAAALGVPAWQLLRETKPRPPKVTALLGMRGAGKSTVGAELAASLKIPLVELDEEIEAAAGMGLGHVFELHGEDYYRRLEHDVLEEVLGRDEPLVLATGGGIVTNERAYAMLLERAWTIWLKAGPQAHWDRVLEQGDRRPMTGRPDAFSELERLWSARAPLYARAHCTMDTQDKSIKVLLIQISERLKARGIR